MALLKSHATGTFSRISFFPSPSIDTLCTHLDTFEFCAKEAAQIFGGQAYTKGGQAEKIERLYRFCVFLLPSLFDYALTTTRLL